MEKSSRIYIAYHEDALGAAILNYLKQRSFENLIVKTKKELDLKNAGGVKDFFEEYKPEYVFLSAGKSGSLAMNIRQPADLIAENLNIELNVIGTARENKVKKLLFFGASCIYPFHVSQPIKEDAYLTGAVEPTSQAYAVAKIAGVEFCRAIAAEDNLNFFTAVPATIYGPGSAFDLENSHVLTALIKKFCDAKTNNEKEATLWGSGKPLREFIYVDDLAEASIFLMENSEKPGEIFNIGSSEEISIHNLAEKVKKVIGFDGVLRFDSSRPDGAERKFLDSAKIKNLGWKPKVSLDEGIKKTVKFYQELSGC